MLQDNQARPLFHATVDGPDGLHNLVLDTLSQGATIRIQAVALDFCTTSCCVKGVAMDGDKQVCRPFICVRDYGNRLSLCMSRTS